MLKLIAVMAKVIGAVQDILTAVSTLTKSVPGPNANQVVQVQPVKLAELEPDLEPLYSLEPIVVQEKAQVPAGIQPEWDRLNAQLSRL